MIAIERPYPKRLIDDAMTNAMKLWRPSPLGPRKRAPCDGDRECEELGNDEARRAPHAAPDDRHARGGLGRLGPHLTGPGGGADALVSIALRYLDAPREEAKPAPGRRRVRGDSATMEPISPELALIDPELAERARALLPDVGSRADLLDEHVEVEAAARPARRWIRREAFGQVAAWLVIPSIALNIALLRTDSAAEPAPVTTAAASSRTAGATPRKASTVPRRPTPRPSTKPKRADVESALHVRTVPRAVEKRVLRWPVTPGSAGYVVVVWRDHKRIADIWTTRPKVAVAAVACRAGKALRAGRYLWFVYPLVDAHPRRYGALAKWGRLVVGAGTRCHSHARD